MKILMMHTNVLPATKYGGRERALWWLSKELHSRGHQISFLAPRGSHADFARIIDYNPEQDINKQIPDDIDIVHLHTRPKQPVSCKPFVVTIGGNGFVGEEYDVNSIFLTKNHAERHGAQAYVYNGLDTDEYGAVDFNKGRRHLHFLAKAAWKLKNVRGAIKLARMSGHKLEVVGGDRLNLKMGFRLTLDPHVHFNGMQGGEKKLRVLRESKGLIFPVLWHEPFGIAIIESMYYGCPVFASPWGSLPEIVKPGFGFLSDSYSELADSMKDLSVYQQKQIHEYTCDNFSAKQMTDAYLKCYEKVLGGENLNPVSPKCTCKEPADFFSMRP
ncbi:MAG: glycosyltransferase [Bacteroidales bacterium]|nr:glycosyltransferase [Bacteroidales bacterium]